MRAVVILAAAAGLALAILAGTLVVRSEAHLADRVQARAADVRACGAQLAASVPRPPSCQRLARGGY